MGPAIPEAPVRTPVKVKAESMEEPACAAGAVAKAEEGAAWAPLPGREDEALYTSMYGDWEDDEEVGI